MTTDPPVGTGAWQSSDLPPTDPDGDQVALEELARRTPGYAKSMIDAADQARERREELDALLAEVRGRYAPMGAEEAAAIWESLTDVEREGLFTWVVGYAPSALRDYASLIMRRRAGQ